MIIKAQKFDGERDGLRIIAQEGETIAFKATFATLEGVSTVEAVAKTLQGAEAQDLTPTISGNDIVFSFTCAMSAGKYRSDIKVTYADTTVAYFLPMAFEIVTSVT